MDTAKDAAMMTAMTKISLDDLHLARPSKQGAALRDYDSVRRAIGFISEQWRTQPTIEARTNPPAVRGGDPPVHDFEAFVNHH